MKKLTLFLLTLIIIPALSKAADWKIINEKSKIEFIATQNDSKITGQFKKFSGKINFDPTQLKTSKVEIEVDLNSVEASLSDAVSTLKTPEWFSVKIFPKAIFVADKFVKVSDKKFTADGKLTIRNKTVPTKIDFALEEYSSKNAKAVGSITIKRSDFEVGPKDPANAHGVKDDVAVSFVVSAIK